MADNAGRLITAETADTAEMGRMELAAFQEVHC